jgi:hypothetical protein
VYAKPDVESEAGVSRKPIRSPRGLAANDLELSTAGPEGIILAAALLRYADYVVDDAVCVKSQPSLGGASLFLSRKTITK